MWPERSPGSGHRPYGSIVAAIAARMANVDAFGTGPLAELRRLDPAGALTEPALHRLVAAHRIDQHWGDIEGLPDWALIIHCLALAAPEHLRFPARGKEPEDRAARSDYWAETSRNAQRGLGRALSEAGFSERRFVNLLDAAPLALRVELPRAVRFLAARGGAVPALALADLVMAEADDGGSGDRVRRRIAGGYYRHEFAANDRGVQA